MENTVYRDEDANLDVLKDKVVAVVGYGIQGRAQALNMRDSGVDVIVGARESRRPDSGWVNAGEDGFKPMSIAEAVQRADVVVFLLADPAQPAVYHDQMHNNLKPGSTLCFGHGFNVLYGVIEPPQDVNVVLFVPNSPGHLVREQFLAGSGIYGAVAVDQDVTGEAKEIVLAIARAVGSTRVGVVEVNFQQETEGDNFEEQVLYGGTLHLMKAIFEIMVENGYPSYFAYAKAIRSLRSIVDVIDNIGIEAYISEHSSRTCEFAVRMSGPRVINRAEIQKVFEATERGEFAARWIEEWRLGMPRLHRLRRTGADSQMEKVGRQWRELFAWQKEC